MANNHYTNYIFTIYTSKRKLEYNLAVKIIQQKQKTYYLVLNNITW